MKHADGTTLTELLVAIAFVGVLAGLAIPAFGGVVERTRAKAVSDRFQTELAYARSEAVFRRRHVIMCRTHDFERCVYSGVWSGGVMTFEDHNHDRDRNAGEPVIRIKQPAAFQGLHLVGSANRPVIGFRPDGRSAGSNITLRLCAESLDALRLLVVNTGGRTRAAPASHDTPACGSD